MTDTDSPVTLPPAREVTPEEWDALVARATDIEKRIRQAIGAGRTALWALVEAAYDFEEEHGWIALGYETKNEWLAQPDIGISRTQFFRMVRTWRTLVVRREVDIPTLTRLDTSKVAIVLPAIETSRVDVDEALADADALAASDLRIKYIRPEEEQDGRSRSAHGDAEGLGGTDAGPGGSEGDPSDTEPQSSAGDRVDKAWSDVSSAIASNQQMPRVRRRSLLALQETYRPEATDGSGTR